MRGLLEAPVVAVQAGLPGAAFDALRVDPSRDVLDGAGAAIGRLTCPPDQRNGVAVAKRILCAAVPLLAPRRRWEVLDASGALALTLRAGLRDLTVTDAYGRNLGVARNVSRLSGAPDITIDVRCADGRKVTFGGPGDQESFGYEIADGQGPLGMLANAGDQTFVLTVGDRLDGDLRALFVGVVCGLVERRWWRLPQRPLP